MAPLHPLFFFLSETYISVPSITVITGCPGAYLQLRLCFPRPHGMNTE